MDDFNRYLKEQMKDDSFKAAWDDGELGHQLQMMVLKAVQINQENPVLGLHSGFQAAENPAPYGEQKPKFTEIDLSKFRVGTIVTHKRYGEGKVAGIKSGKVMVSFDVANKTFLFPDAIEKGFLTVKEW